MRTSMPPCRSALQLHVVHEAAHEEDAAPAGFEHVLGREGIGDLLGLEAFALVGDLTTSSVGLSTGVNGELDGDEFGADARGCRA